jgi:hypothetical protein
MDSYPSASVRQSFQRFRSLQLSYSAFELYAKVLNGQLPLCIGDFIRKRFAMFGVHSLSGNAYGYSSLTNDESTEKPIYKSSSPLSNGLFKSLVLVLAVSSVGGIGFFAGRWSSPSSKTQNTFQRQYIETKALETEQ